MCNLRHHGLHGSPLWGFLLSYCESQCQKPVGRSSALRVEFSVIFRRRPKPDRTSALCVARVLPQTHNDPAESYSHNYRLLINFSQRQDRKIARYGDGGRSEVSIWRLPARVFWWPVMWRVWCVRPSSVGTDALEKAATKEERPLLDLRLPAGLLGLAITPYKGRPARDILNNSAVSSRRRCRTSKAKVLHTIGNAEEFGGS